MTPTRPSRSNRPARNLLVASVIAALLAGCSILPKQENIRIWQPTTTVAPNAGITGNFSVRVDTPHAAGTLDQAGIVVMPAPGEVSTYKGARWNESPAVLVRQRLVDAFMAAKLPAVTTDDDHFSSDFTLSGDLRAFQSEYRNGAPVVVVRYDAQLRRGGSRTPLATRSFVVTGHPAGTQVPAVVAAFGTADDQLARDVVAWVVGVARAHPQDDPGAAK